MELINIFWFRRDLRLNDNTGLARALNAGLPVLPLFIFDSNILDALEDRDDKRVNFIYEQLQQIQRKLVDCNSSLFVFYGDPAQIFESLTRKYKIHTVFANHDYEPYAMQRDREVGELLNRNNIRFLTYKDQVIFEKKELVKDNGEPYSVFTPYARKWKSKISDELIAPVNSGETHNFHQTSPQPIPSMDVIGFQKNAVSVKPLIDMELLKQYDGKRNYPGENGTSRLGIHLRFGTISIRELVGIALRNSEAYLKELIWREFFMQMLWHHPGIMNECYRPEYERIRWRNHPEEFEIWCNGKTGYALVDAGMRELNATGYMHNRVRMVAASFLVKHLLIDWRWGEAYFARKLLDFELSSNVGNWQWITGCGFDAAPYFRIFNPAEQVKKFDPALRYISEWIPELHTPAYPAPIVEHKYARERCLEVFKKALAVN